MNGTAFYGGSFDPFTEGHMAIVSRALLQCDKLIIGVGVNPDKKGLLSEDQRVDLIKASLNDFVSFYQHRNLSVKDFSYEEQLAAIKLIDYPHCVDVVSYTGLTVDAAIKYEADVLIRGERLVGDHDAEMQLAHINNELCEIRGYNLQHLQIPVPKADLTYVSSTAVKTLLAEGEYIVAMKYVSPSVHNFLCEKMLREHEYSKLTNGTCQSYGALVRECQKKKYHNFSHIAYMLNFLKIFKVLHSDLLIPSKVIEMAIFWHDFLHSEVDSAAFAYDVAKKVGLDDSDWVKNLVLATNHRSPIISGPKETYTGLIHDLDLAILGDVQNYGAYAWKIRLECKDNLVSYAEYVKGRVELLNSFLKRDRIYFTEYFYERFEENARENIRKERDFWLSKKL